MFVPNLSFLPYNFFCIKTFHFPRRPGAQWPRHLPGHLIVIVAKQVPRGQEIMVMCCEGISISGNFYRKKWKYLTFFCRRMIDSQWLLPLLCPQPFLMKVWGQAALNTSRCSMGPTALWQEEAKGCSCCPQGCTLVAYGKVCLNPAPGSEAGWKNQAVTATPRKEEEGQDPLPEGRTACKASENSPKRTLRRKLNTQRSSRLSDSWSEPNKDCLLLKMYF